MIFNNFELHATPFISNASCKCGQELKQVSNGFFSFVLYCPKCENIYKMKMVKIPKKKISKEFLEQCRKNKE